MGGPRGGPLIMGGMGPRIGKAPGGKGPLGPIAPKGGLGPIGPMGPLGPNGGTIS